MAACAASRKYKGPVVAKRQDTKSVAKPVVNPVKFDADKKKMKDKISAPIEEYEKKYGHFVRNY